MKSVIVAAFSQNRVIGKTGGGMLWHIPEDLKHFKKLTEYHPIIMGRKTFEDIGKPLDKRVNIIVTHNPNFKPKRTVVCKSIEEALEKAKDYGDIVYIIGGRQIYQQTINLVDRLEITEIHRYVDGDIYFPKIDYAKWKEVNKSDFDEFSFVSYIRR